MEPFNQQLNEIRISFLDFLRDNRAERKQNTQIFYGLMAIVVIVMTLTGVLGYKLLAEAQKQPEIPIVQKIDTGESRLAFDETNKRIQALTGNLMLTAGGIDEIKAALKRIEQIKAEKRVEIRTVYVEREKKHKKPKPRPKPKPVAETEWLPQAEVDAINALPKKPMIDIKNGEAVIFERKGGR